MLSLLIDDSSGNPNLAGDKYDPQGHEVASLAAFHPPVGRVSLHVVDSCKLNLVDLLGALCNDARLKTIEVGPFKDSLPPDRLTPREGRTRYCVRLLSDNRSERHGPRDHSVGSGGLYRILWLSRNKSGIGSFSGQRGRQSPQSVQAFPNAPPNQRSPGVI